MKKENSYIWKASVAALVAGLLGGGIAYGGINAFQNSGINTAVPTSSNSGGSATQSNINVNVQNQTEKAYQAVKNSVVSVVNLKAASQSDNQLAQMFGFESGNSSNSGKSKSELEASSEGSGLIYKKSGDSAYIVTNNHVVAGSSALEVILSDGKKVEAKIVGRDEVTDLAVLKINSSVVNQVATFGNSDNIKVGETSLAIGSPMGSSYASSLTQGIISAKKREVQQTSSNGQATGNTATVIQTDTAINPGNSGGPLINLAGQVIGINSMKLSSDGEGTSVEGIGFAIPSNEVVNIINQLVEHGKVIRPALGIQYVDLTNISAQQQKSILKLPESVKNGVVVMKTTSDSPAANAGISKYDVITKFAGKNIESQNDIRDILYKQKVGSTVSVTYYHNGKAVTKDMKLDKQLSQINFGK